MQSCCRRLAKSIGLIGRSRAVYAPCKDDGVCERRTPRHRSVKIQFWRGCSSDESGLGGLHGPTREQAPCSETNSRERFDEIFSNFFLRRIKHQKYQHRTGCPPLANALFHLFQHQSLILNHLSSTTVPRMVQRPTRRLESSLVTGTTRPDSGIAILVKPFV
jgi:hypothetical protein